MGVAFSAGRQKAHQIYMNMSKVPAGDWNRLRWSYCKCWIVLGLLAGLALLAPTADISGHAFPHEPAGQESSGGPYTWVGYGVDC